MLSSSFVPKKYTLKCSGCGKDQERTARHKEIFCFECKKKRKRERYQEKVLPLKPERERRRKEEARRRALKRTLAFKASVRKKMERIRMKKERELLPKVYYP